MTAVPKPEPTSPSRRALLAGALGGIGAWAASAVGRSSPVRAMDGDTMLVGEEMTSETSTKVTISAGYPALWGSAPNNEGVRGESLTWVGVRGTSSSYIGVYGTSTTHVGVLGYSGATDQAAIRGQNGGNSTGVQGVSSSTAPPAPKPKTGVYGYANQDSNSKGVYGESPAGYAGYFAGKVYSTKFYELNEISNPAAPSTNRARLFVRDNGAGKTQLCVKFEFGAVQVIATQP